MVKVLEFNVKNEILKNYFTELLQEEKINYKLNIEDRWIQHVKGASKFYQVYCVYVNEDDFERAKKIADDYVNSTIIIEENDELINAENIEPNNLFAIFTKKNFYILYWGGILFLAIMLGIIIYFSV